VVAPDYGAETPIEVADQTKAQHDERVDQASQTKFGVGTKHRFGGTLSQSVTTSLAGETRLEPAKVEGAPGQLTYTAPNAQDLKATVLLRSTSKRGIGVLVLDFHTGRAAWTGVLTRKETVTAVHEGGGRSDKVTTTYDSQVKLGQTVSTTAGSDRLNGTISGSYALDGVHTSAWSQESCLKNFSGIDTTTESANGQGSADTTVTVATDLRTYHVTTGSASLANAVRGQSMRQSHQLVAGGNGCNVEARQTTSSFPITQALSLAGIEVTGDLDPKDPNHISGSRTETKEVTGTTTVVTITWDLTRK
jgi:hypothetical protein